MIRWDCTRIFGATVLLLLSLDSSMARAETPRDIMYKTEVGNRALSEFNDVTMVLVYKSGHTRTRKLRYWKKKVTDTTDKRLIRFDSPGEIAGTGLLTIAQDGRPDDQFLYLPALRRARRIRSDSHNKYFVGTDFTYEDLKNWVMDNHEYKLLRKESVGDRPCFVIESVPKPSADSGYSRLVTWIDQDLFVVHRRVYYDRSGRKLKTYDAKNLRKIEDKYRFLDLTMTNHDRESKTHLKMDRVQLNQTMPDGLFTQENLKNEF